MARRPVGDVTLDVCRACRGVWVDPGELEAAAGCRKTTPCSLVRSPDHALDDDGFAGYVLPRDHYLEVGEGPEQLLVEGSNRVPSPVVLIPRLIVVPRRGTKRFHDGAQVMRILETDVLPNCPDPLARRFCGHRVRGITGSGNPAASFELGSRLLQGLSRPSLPL